MASSYKDVHVCKSLPGGHDAAHHSHLSSFLSCDFSKPTLLASRRCSKLRKRGFGGSWCISPWKQIMLILREMKASGTMGRWEEFNHWKWIGNLFLPQRGNLNWEQDEQSQQFIVLHGSYILKYKTIISISILICNTTQYKLEFVFFTASLANISKFCSNSAILVKCSKWRKQR